MASQDLVIRSTALGLLVCTTPCLAEGAQVEYAIRWLANGSPVNSAAQVLTLLGKRAGKTRESEVRYYRATEGYDSSAIFRGRTGEVADVTWKVRIEGQDPSAAAGGLGCPLLGDVKAKTEVDVSVTGKSGERRTSSRSCRSEEPLEKALPPAIKLTDRGCASRMVRVEAKDKSVVVERWELADGRVILEASSKGKESAAALGSFRKDVAHKLIEAKVVPSELSKTELVTQC
ncbi:hypothetical protein KGA65_16310 [Ideonella sp. B7]|uniref:hypothetical protein n=1 Tax=Ideonella benzenivorans TaxID=2831643 RepID=UPI001CECF125|nr:hypothetical protein [Ideonella benzenivorans]MCA6218099.1 hypothetical protein [Ideonella benzenivorans]